MPPMGNLSMKNPLPHTFYQERFDSFRFDVFSLDIFHFDAFRFDAFRFATGRSLAHPDRAFRCDSINTLGIFDPLPQAFLPGALRCLPLRCWPHSLNSLACQHSRLQPGLEASASHRSSIYLRLLQVCLLSALLVTIAATPCFGALVCRHSA
jgi:hypothetical protein